MVGGAGGRQVGVGADRPECGVDELHDPPERVNPFSNTWDNSMAICALMRLENSADVREWLQYHRYGPPVQLSEAVCAIFVRWCARWLQQPQRDPDYPSIDWILVAVTLSARPLPVDPQSLALVAAVF